MTFDLNEAAKNLHDLQKVGKAMGLHDGPGLGSGALREGDEVWVRAKVTKFVEPTHNGVEIRLEIGHGTLMRTWCNAADLLSLSSPIEPEAQYDALTLMQAVRRRVEKYQWDSGDANQEATSIANDIIGVVKRALTPSRQGAAKRVEG